MPLLFIVATVITGFIALCLLFFQTTRKTYPGFGYWTAGVGFLALGYLFYALKGQIPLWSTVFFGNLVFSLGMVLHLDGIRRFLDLTPASRIWYVLPGAVLAGLALFYFQWNLPTWRNLVATVPLTAVHWTMAGLIFRSAVRPRSIFYKVIGSLLGVAGLLLLVRAVWLVSAPDPGVIFKSPLELAFFTSFIVLHLGENLSLVMLNAERVESELKESQSELRLAVDQLQRSLDQQKRTEESLRDSEDRYRNFFNTSRDPVFMTNLDGQFVDYNDFALESFGYAPEDKSELLRINVAAIYANPEEREAHITLVAKQGFSKEYPLELRKKDGTIMQALITTVARRDTNGNIVGFQGTVRDITERNKAEQALRESEEKYRRLHETMMDAFVIVDMTGRILEANQAYQKMLDYTEEELRQLTYTDLTPEKWHAFETRIVKEEILAKGCSEVYEKEYRRKDGIVLNVELRTFLLRDKSGCPQSMWAIARDITGRKKAEEALRESEAKYRFLIEHGSDLIWTLDLNLRTTFVTQSVEKVLGFTPEERMQQKVEDQLPPESLKHARQRLLEELNIEREQGIQKGKSVLLDLDYYHKNGSIVCLQTAVTFIRDEKGTPIGLHGISRDITELKRTQQALTESAELLAEAQRVAKIGNWSYDLRENKVTWSDELYRIFRLDKPELHGRYESFLERVHPEDRQLVLQANDRARKEGTPFDLEYRIVLPSGEIRTVREVGHASRDEEGTIIRLFGTAQDITEFKKAEEQRQRLKNQLAHAQKMEAVGTLASGIAHDFNNLLTIINGYTELILSEKTEDDPSYSDLQTILETGRKGAELVRRLLTLSKKSKINLRSCSLNQIAKDSVALMKRTIPKMIEIETAFAKNLAMVNADAGQIEQVILNLCINAKEAMPEGGKLRIETQIVSVDEAYCRIHPEARPGSFVLLEVADTGTGMDKETLDRMFDPFFTTKGWDYKKGTGLGLAVAKGIMDQHGGWITCDSELGKGTTFRIYFPAIVEAPVLQKSQHRTEPVRGTAHILLVDDEQHVRDLGKRILESAGFTVITASNGDEALEIYAKRSDIALVILDLIMPHMGGEKALEEILKVNPLVKVVVSTGHSLDVRERLHIGALARGFVNKPYEVKQLIQTVREVLEGSGPV